jgi:hypothetical protein
VLSAAQVKTDCKQAEQALKLLVAQARNTLSIDEQVAVLVKLLDALPNDLQPVKRQEAARTDLRAQEKKVALELRELERSVEARRTVAGVRVGVEQHIGGRGVGKEGPPPRQVR